MVHESAGRCPVRRIAGAAYGRLWRQGFDLALDKINTEGGVNGRKVELRWEDSQSDPKQTVPIAQKFVDDEEIVAELGDFSSPASMAASNVYQNAGLVQFGFTNSHPDFTKGGDYLWSPSLTQETLQDANAGFVAKYAKKVSVLYQQTDWGRSAFASFAASAAKRGVQIAYQSAFLPDSTDFRPVLINARDARPDAVVAVPMAHAAPPGLRIRTATAPGSRRCGLARRAGYRVALVGNRRL